MTSAQPSATTDDNLRGLTLVKSFKQAPYGAVAIGWSADGTIMAATAANAAVVWSPTSSRPRLLKGHDESAEVLALAWHPLDHRLATASADGTVRIWDGDDSEARSSVFCSAGTAFRGVAWSPDGLRLATTDKMGFIAVWDVVRRTTICAVRAHNSSIATSPCWSPDGEVLVTGDRDGLSARSSSTLNELWRRSTGSVRDVAISPDGRLVASTSGGQRAHICDLAGGAEIAVLEAAGYPQHFSFSPDGEFLASSTALVEIWRCHDWERVATIPVANAGLAFHPSRLLIAAKADFKRRIDCFLIDEILRSVGLASDSRRYVNAKVVLLGDTGVGKSGLGLVLSGQAYQPTDSTHGRNVWTFDSQQVVVPGSGKQTREVLLWDLAGQPGYRLIHQLHLGEVAVALVVFDSRSETEPFSGVKHWVRALAQARRIEGDAAIPLRAYLVAARADRGGIPVTRERIEAMVAELGLDGFFETSAKEGWQVTELTAAIRDGIAWDRLPMVSSNALFESIKHFLVEEKERGRLLATADDLFRGFQRAEPALAGENDLRASFGACVGRVESRGLIRRLQFGDLVLLQPELLDAYASALVQAAKDEPDGLGYIGEDEVLAGRFRMADSERINDKGQEKLLLIATVEELLRHEIALRETTDRGVDLIFPSQFTVQRPDAPNIAGRALVFAFEGPLANIYATLAVRLSHSSLFRRQAMWQGAATYTATGGGTCGIAMREIDEGRGELAVFYDYCASEVVRLQFETYVFEHLQLRALPGTVTRRRVRDCPACGYVLPDDLVQGRIERGGATIRCPMCDESTINLIGGEISAGAEAAVAVMDRSADERRDSGVAATRLKGKIETADFDVFLCYNSADRQRVIAIAERLKERGILPWLDIWEIPPGVRWQDELHKRLKSIRSAAVFIGPKGAGPWQELEVQALLDNFAKRRRPIIPVILEGREGRPRLPPFLNLLHVVDLRQPDPDPFDQLVWGITGERAISSV